MYVSDEYAHLGECYDFSGEQFITTWWAIDAPFTQSTLGLPPSTTVIQIILLKLLAQFGVTLFAGNFRQWEVLVENAN